MFFPFGTLFEKDLSMKKIHNKFERVNIEIMWYVCHNAVFSSLEWLGLRVT